MKMTISQKLLGGFLAVLIILTTIAGIGYYQIDTVDNEYNHLINDRVNKLILVENLGLEAKSLQSHFRGYIILGDNTTIENFTKAHEKYLLISKEFHNIITLEKAKELIKELDKLENDFYIFSNRMIELKKQNKEDEYTSSIATEGRAIMNQFEQKQAELIDYQQNLLNDGNKAVTLKVAAVKKLFLILGVLAILLGLVIAYFIGRSISKPIVMLSKAAEQIASGNLSLDNINVKNRDEIGDLATSFNQMAKNLRNVIHQVGSSAAQVAATSEELTASAEQTGKATEQIAATMQEMATGAEKQVRKVEDTSAALNEVSTGIQHIATNANIVSTSAIETSDKAAEGNLALQTAVKQMNSINQTVMGLSEMIRGLSERSKEIGNINNVITDIAAQTNLLALNAAIEAARAAEHGRGFSVVAEEVRKLAEQSAQSAQQISQLISIIQKETENAVVSMESAATEVAEGIIIVDSAGKKFDEIQLSINEVTNQIQEVSTSAEEVSAGSEQVVASTKAITEIAEESASGTQNVAAAAEEQLASMEEITASASALSNMAEELQALINKFKV
ncbi:MAG TPA: methyl-accepting chemotaxis protein [Bacillus bacterium]|nr:methyl-accepting chemotaxis protein [Bacillus sp. (in: firmicutes)]